MTRRIGQGGFGETWKAARTSDGLAVVVKLLRVERAESWKAIELFERESRVLESLDHPGIPDYIDDGIIEENQRIFLVQEFVDGEDLSVKMRNEARLTAADIQRYFEDILRVLCYLHAKVPPVVHRDIKPSNIIVRPDGSAVLIDFGTVQSVLGSTGSTAAGSFGYAPMEQFVGRAVPASDLYSLAMTALALATRTEPEQMPFESNRVQVGAMLRPLDFDPRFILLLEELTEPDASRRPESAQEVLDRLQGITPSVPSRPRVRRAAAAAVGADEVRAHLKESLKRSRRVRKQGFPPLTRELHDVVAPAFVDPVLLLGETMIWSLNLKERKGSPLFALGGVSHRFAYEASGRVAVTSDFMRSRPLVFSPTSPTPVPIEGDQGFERAALSPDGRLLALSSRMMRSEIRLCEKKGDRFAAGSTIAADAAPLTFSPDGTVLIASRHGDTLCFRGSDSRKIDDQLWAFSPDGRVAVCAGPRVRVGTCDTYFPPRLTKDRTVLRDEGRWRSIWLSPTGDRVVLTRSENRVLIDLTTDTVYPLSSPFAGPVGELSVNQVLFLPDVIVVSGSSARHPWDPKPDDAVFFFDNQGQGLGSIVTAEVKKGDLALVGVTVDGWWAELPGTRAQEVSTMSLIELQGSERPYQDLRPVAGRPRSSGIAADLVLRRLLGEPLLTLVEGEDLDAALDFGARSRAFAQATAEALRDPGDLRPIFDASRGIAPLIPYALQQAQSGADRPGFGDDAHRITTDQLATALRALSERSDGELDVIFEGQLDHLVSTELARRRADRPGGTGLPFRVNAWLLLGLLIFLSFVVSFFLRGSS